MKAMMADFVGNNKAMSSFVHPGANSNYSSVRVRCQSAVGIVKVTDLNRELTRHPG